MKLYGYEDAWREGRRVRRALREGVRRSDGTIAGPLRPRYVEDCIESFSSVYSPLHARVFRLALGRLPQGVAP